MSLAAAERPSAVCLLSSFNLADGMGRPEIRMLCKFSPNLHSMSTNERNDLIWKHQKKELPRFPRLFIAARHHPEEGGKSSNSSRHDGWGRGRRAAEAQARRSYRAGFIPLKKNDLILCDMAKVGGSGERFGADLGKGSTPIWHGHCQNPPNISPNS